MARKSSTRISETVYIGPFKLGGSVGKSGVRLWAGTGNGHGGWLDVSKWFPAS